MGHGGINSWLPAAGCYSLVMGDRRDFLIGMTMAAMPGQVPEQGTIYIPERHSEKERAYLLDFMEEFSFAMVVTGQPAVQITNVPTILERAPEGWGKIWWHLAKANPQNEAMKSQTTIVFHGPHQYISPNWYQRTTPCRRGISRSCMSPEAHAGLTTTPRWRPDCGVW
jgi:hypothetical protein